MATRLTVSLVYNVGWSISSKGSLLHMVSYIWNRVSTHFSIFIGFYRPKVRIELSLTLAYIWPLLPILAVAALCWLSFFIYAIITLLWPINYFGCSRFIMVLIATDDSLISNYSNYHSLALTDCHLNIVIIIGYYH